MPTNEAKANFGESITPDLTRLLEVADDIVEALTSEVRDEFNMLKTIANSYNDALDLLESWANGGRPVEATLKFIKRERGE